MSGHEGDGGQGRGTAGGQASDPEATQGQRSQPSLGSLSANVWQSFRRIPWARSLRSWGWLLTGVATTFGLLFAAGSLFLDFRSQRVEIVAAQQEADAARLAISPVAEFVYWLGPPASDLSGPNAASSLPKEFKNFRIVQTPGDWSIADPTELLDGVDVQCETSGCRSAVSDPDRVVAAHHVVWLVLINAGSSTMQSISIEWKEIDTEPAESSDPFAVVRNDDLSAGAPEALVDLSPGAGLIVPAASVLRIPALGTVSTVPLGHARVPVALQFTMFGESEEQRVAVREPADVLVTGGYEFDDGHEVFEGGG